MTSPLFPRRQRGVGIVTAIFLLVVLAVLAITLTTFTTQVQVSSGLDIQGARAYQAARAGVEYALYQYLQGDKACRTAPVTTNLTPAAPTLAGFTVTVTCTPSAAQPQVNATIVAVACNYPTSGACPATGSATTNVPDFVRRQVEVTF